MAFETLDLVEGVRGEVTLTAVRTAHHRDVLDDQQVFASAVSFADVTEARSGLATDVANDLMLPMFFHSEYTVITISLPVGLSFATTSTGLPSVAPPCSRYFH